MTKSQRAKAGDHHQLIVYYITLLLLAVGAFFPNGRVWGFNWWGYYPVWVPIGLLAVGILMSILTRDRFSYGLDDDAVTSNRYWVIAAGVGVVFVVGFATLYARTHFLGDGWTLISLVSAKQPLIKWREIGESLAHIWLRDLLGGPTEAATVMSFRVISITSGALFVVLSGCTAFNLFRATVSRLLFLLGMLSGGYMLLFFGYVENYSLFVMSVGLYIYIGIFISEDRLHRAWILLPHLLAAFLHIFGVVLLPATVYLLIRNTKLTEWLSRTRWSIRLGLVGFTGAVLLLLFFYEQANSLFFRLAVLPITAHRLTVAGYTLFSSAHLIDYLNLVFMLAPGVVLLLVTLRYRQAPWDWVNPAIRFLVIAATCGLGAAFIFDPKLGMPRDWDLFAFAGVPLTALVFYLLLGRKPTSLVPAVLAIALGLLLLGPRVVSQVVPDIAFAHACNYKDIDQIKNRNLYAYLVPFLKERGREEEANRLYAEWDRRFPGRAQSVQLVQLMAKRQVTTAKQLANHILARNPQLHDVWRNLGVLYDYQQNTDSAIICYEISLAMNPGNATLMADLAATFIKIDEIEAARKLLLEAIAVDSNKAQSYYQMARIARLEGDRDAYLRNLDRSAACIDATPRMITDLLQVEASRGNIAHARELLNTALDHGLDSAYVDSFVAKYPGLAHH